MNNPFREITLINKLLLCNVCELSGANISKIVFKLSPEKKRKVVILANKILTKRSISKSSSLTVRQKACYLLISALPDSQEIIVKLLKRKDDDSYEIHFTFFCCLDEFTTCKTNKMLSIALILIEDYLMGIAAHKDTAGAAWKAAESLACHHPLKITLPILFKVAKSAKYIAGRNAALDSMHELLLTKEATKLQKQEIFKCLKYIANNDRSTKLRRSARWPITRFIKIK